jgi:hypothetical protein
MTAPSKKISTWRERIGQSADFPLHVPTDVERAMVAEISELRAAVHVPSGFKLVPAEPPAELVEQFRKRAVFGFNEERFRSDYKACIDGILPALSARYRSN